MKKISNIIDFFEKDIWKISPAELCGTKRLLIAVLKRVVLTCQGYIKKRMDYRAAALTYSTLLATVPLLSIVFAISRGFGFNKLLENEIRANFNAQPETIDTMIGVVNSYLTHTKSGIFIGFGLCLLFWTLISLTSNIEQAFNQIWQVKRLRTPFRQFTDYTAIFFVLPLFIIITSGLSLFITTVVNGMSDLVILGTTAKVIIKLSPYAFVCFMFTALYVFMPNTKVKVKSALVAGFFAGTAFQALQYLYINSQLWVSGYNAIYGSFAAIPLFMLFCQISWNICLAGGELSYVDQNIDNFLDGSDSPELNRCYRDFLCIVVSAAVCRQFASGGSPLTALQIAKDNRLPIRLVNDVLYDLCSAGILVEIACDGKDDNSVYQPKKALKLLTVAHLMESLSESSGYGVNPDIQTSHQKYWDVLEGFNNSAYSGSQGNKRLDEI